MKFTKAERLLLYNQYRILEALYPKEKKDFAKYREIITDGYELEFESLTRHIFDGLSRAECLEVLDVMDMFSTIQRAYESLEDKTAIDKYKVSFHGFSGNDETMQMAYARFLQENGRFTDLETDDNCNSHFPALNGHRQMLAEWNNSENKFELTREDILRIQTAFMMH